MLHQKFLVLLLWGVLSSSPGWGETKVDEIVAKVLKRDEELSKLQEEMEFDLVLTHEKLDRDNTVISTREAKVRIQPGGESAYQQVVGAAGTDDSGKPLEEKDQKNVNDAQNAMKQMKLRKLAPRFDIALEGAGREQGLDCWILKYTPKPGQTAQSREEKIINQLSGKFWVSKADYSIVKSVGKLTGPVSIAWFMAKMRELEFDYYTLPLASGNRMPARFEMSFDLQVPMSYVRRRQVSVMENYRKPVKSPPPKPALP